LWSTSLQLTSLLCMAGILGHLSRASNPSNGGSVLDILDLVT
jgi:hypothetical protein